MTKRPMTKERAAMLKKGLMKAAASPRTPPHLKKGITKGIATLERKYGV